MVNVGFLIGDRVRIIVGNNKGLEGEFKGLQNNANWYVVEVGGSQYLVNPEELELIEPTESTEIDEALKEIEEARKLPEVTLEDLPKTVEVLTGEKPAPKRHRRN